jgi:hypothetical protein
MGSINKYTPHKRVDLGWARKCKKHNYLVHIYTFREAVELGGARWGQWCCGAGDAK